MSDSKMKVTWNKNPKQRSRLALSNFSNLPFEKESSESQSQLQSRGDDFERRQTSDELDSSEVVGTHSGSHGNFDPEAKTLAEPFRVQGDKLSEESNWQVLYFDYSA